MKYLYLVVLESNPLELADSGLIFEDEELAKIVATNYSIGFEKCMVRKMIINKNTL